METSSSSSYKQIVKSTGIFGGSQVINILIGIVRNKIIAVLLGATGIGLIGIYQSIIDMIRNIGGLGMEMTGVKEIAAADGKHNTTNLSLTIFTVRRLVQLTAILGAGICLIFCYPISLWAFGDASHTVFIASLSIVILLSTLLQGQLIALQGIRKISIMAKVLLLGNFLSLIVTMPFLFLWRLDGILPLLIVGTALYYALSLKFYSKVQQQLAPIPQKPTFREILKKGKSMFHLGAYLVIASIVNTLTMFLIRIFLSKNISLDAAGLFQSVWAITNVYLMLILKSMGSDFFPRLCALSKQRVASVRLINQQTLVALVVATPIIVGMLLFGIIALTLLYSSKFLPAESLLQWQILGTFFKIASWPMAFILLAKNKGKQYIFSEILFFLVYYGMNYLLFPHFGLDAAGIAYLIAYIIYFAIIFGFSVRLIRFNWSKKVWQIFSSSSLFVLGAFLFARIFHGLTFYFGGSVLFFLSCAYTIWQFDKIVPIKDVYQKLVSFFRK